MKLRLISFFFIFYLAAYCNSNEYNKVTVITNKLAYEDFDWEYYVQHNNLYHLKNEKDALEHYQKIGFFDKLKYCERFTIVILLDLYDVGLIDEYIDRINNFVRLNRLNNYILKINIPLDNRLETFNHRAVNNIISQVDEDIFIAKSDYENLTTKKDNKILYGISKYLKENIEIKENNIQLLFSEAHGAEIGGFFLLLDQVIKQKIEHDFIIKLHTHVKESERRILTSLLHIKLNKMLRKFKALYATQQLFDSDKENLVSKNAINQVLNSYQLNLRNFNFCPGGIFIVSQAFTNFFKNYDVIDLYNKLPKNLDYNIQQAYEKFFGYLIDYLDLNVLVTGPHSFRYYYDNSVAINSSILLNYNLKYAKQLIKANNIKLMAIYFPQFHEFEENNKLWGKGFTEWTLMNRYKGEIKRPHVDVGQYNMLEYSTRKKQALMAKDHGIDAFCYYHYWFTGKKVMHAGLEKILEDNEPDLPFIFCWANEPWTRNWDGSTREVLIDQKYGNLEDWKKHFDYLLPFFKHPNYIKEDNCPVFFIYRLEHIIKNNALEMLKLWKTLALEKGFNGLKIISILGAFGSNKKLMPGYTDGFAEHMPTCLIKELAVSKTKINDAQEINKKISNLERLDTVHYSGMFYNFDNSSRRVNLPVIRFSRLSYKSLENIFVNTIFRIAKKPHKGINYILLNSWNEWTEQAMFEPNDIDGYRLLEITKKFFR